MPSKVTNFVFYITFFVSLTTVAKDGFKHVVILKPNKIFSKFSFTCLYYRSDNRGGVIKPKPCRNSSYVSKDGCQTFKQAFLIFSFKKLHVALITVRERNGQVFTIIPFSGFIKLCCTKINLSFSWDVFQFYKTVIGSFIYLLTPCSYIIRNRFVTAVKSVWKLFFKSNKDPFPSMPLLPFMFQILKKPLINSFFEFV